MCVQVCELLTSILDTDEFSWEGHSGRMGREGSARAYPLLREDDEYSKPETTRCVCVCMGVSVGVCGSVCVLVLVCVC